MGASSFHRLLRVTRKALALPPRELGQTAHAAMLFGLAELSLRLRPMAWTARRFAVSLVPTAPASPPPQLTPADLRAVRSVRRLSPRIYGSERGCLRRSLVLGRLLRHHDPVMRIGVGRDEDGQFGAHAWIELGGHALESPGNHVAFDVEEGQF